METARIDEADGTAWPLRPAMLAVLGLATGLAIHFIAPEDKSASISLPRLMLLSFVTVAPILFGFVVARAQVLLSAGFAVAGGLIAALIVYWNGSPESWSAGEGWRIVSLALAIGIAAPLFQAWLETAASGERPRFAYPTVHDYAWIDVVLWAASWVFVGIVFLMLFLLSELFALIGLDFLKDLLGDEWFWQAIIGLAFGGGLGLLREQGRVVQLLQRVVTTVLAVLAPVLAVGLVFFLLALPFTGLDPLWDAWTSATGLMLACVVGALILANDVIGDREEHQTRNPVLRIGALALGVVMLPLAVLAAFAIGLRIGQYGFTPDRLWALTFAAIASAYGLAYFVSAVLGRFGWGERVRPANLRLAFGICGLALLLATPIPSFNAIATRDQVARLKAGKVSPDKFDWAALAFDFGPSGRAAVKRLAANGDGDVRALAKETLGADDRWDAHRGTKVVHAKKTLDDRLRVLPAGTALPDGVRDILTNYSMCGLDNDGCTVVVAGPREVFALDGGCYDGLKTDRGDADRGYGVAQTCANPRRAVLANGKWEARDLPVIHGDIAAAKAGMAEGDVEIRTVERRQIFVGGVPVGDAIE